VRSARTGVLSEYLLADHRERGRPFASNSLERAHSQGGRLVKADYPSSEGIGGPVRHGMTARAYEVVSVRWGTEKARENSTVSKCVCELKFPHARTLGSTLRVTPRSCAVQFLTLSTLAL
jgi:hypothetical protein